MSNKYILDRNGNPIECDDLFEQAEWRGKADVHVSISVIGDVKVSTVFLGLDHNSYGGTPILYETMIFGGEHDGYQDRYATRKEAIEGHEKAIKIVKGEIDD